MLRAEQSRAEQSRAEQSRAEQSTQDCNLTGIACQVPEVMLCHF